MAIPLTEPVFLRSSRNFSRVICLQDHSMYWLEAPHVFEQSNFRGFRPRRQTSRALVSIGSKLRTKPILGCPSKAMPVLPER
jgi:hypothetical protein